MTAELRRNLVLAAIGLLGGFGLIVALFGSAELMKRPFAPAGQGGPPATADGQAGEKTAEGKSGETKPTADSNAPEPGPAGKPNSGAPDSRAEGATAPGSSANGGTSSQGEADAKQAANTPSFDLVRVEPTGETVVAGRGAPNTAIEMLVNGKPVARALADPNGQFALVPPALSPGDSEIALRIVDPQGRETRSAQSVAVVVAPDRKTRPLVALSAPGRPTVVLSQPDAVAANEPSSDASPADRAAGSSAGSRETRAADAKPAGPDSGDAKSANGKSAAGTSSGADGHSGKAVADARRPGAPGQLPAKAPSALKIVSVDAQEGGRLYVTGQAVPGATVRLYLNDTLVAPASVGPDGKVVFTIGKGVAAGQYRVRIDQVDSVTGAVRTRAEVPFVFPEAAARVASREPAGEGARALSRPDEGRAVAALPPPGVKPEPGPHAASGPRSGSASAPGATSKPGSESERASTSKVVPAPNPSVAHAAPGSAAASHEVLKPSQQATGAPADALAAASGSTEAPAAGSAGSAFVAEIATAKITRGDNLWQISRRVYGSGLRYTVIYDANQEQIRDPDKIFPGQIFVLPKDAAKEAPKEGRGGRG